MRIPGEHAVVAWREWLKIFIPAAAFVAALVAATVAWKQFGLARWTSEQQLRAYVMVDKAEMNYVGDVANVIVRIKNFGKTPATITRAWLRVDVGPYPLGDQSLSKADVTETTGKGAMAPDGSFDLRWKQTAGVPSERLTAIKSGAQAWYIHGEVYYVDAFDTPRVTHFRYLKGGKFGVDGSELQADIEGNQAN